MKRPGSVFNVIAAYYVLTYVFYLQRVESFFKDILIAPQYLTVPAGMGRAGFIRTVWFICLIHGILSK